VADIPAPLAIDTVPGTGLACSASSTPEVTATEGSTMSVSEHDRHHLFTWFEEHMGSERAATMMGLLPPTGWGDAATRRDLDLVRRDLELLEARIDARFDQHEARLDAKLDQLRAEHATLRSELLRTFGTWLFASQAAVIAAVSLLFTLR
jgi:hypothetical protein